MICAIVASFLISSLLLVRPSTAFAEPAIELTPPSGEAGTLTTVDGSGYVPRSIVTITFDGGNMKTRPDTIQADVHGAFRATFEVPHSIGEGNYVVKATGHGLPRVNASATFQVTVPNSPPIAHSQSVVIEQDRELNIVLRGSDADGDSITFAIVDEPQHGTIRGFDPTSGSLMFIPTGDYEGRDRFTFKVNDGRQDSFLAEVAIRILATGGGPRMEDSHVQVVEDGMVDVKLRVSNNDSSSVTFEIVTSPSHGRLDIIRPYDDTSAFVKYTPNLDFNGTDTFTAKARDTRFESRTATITLTVTPLQDDPRAHWAQYFTTQDKSIAITLNATDIDGDVLVYSIESQPSRGTLTGTAPALTYVPSGDYRGWDSFTFKVNDGTVDSETARVEIRVEAAAEAVDAGESEVSNSDGDTEIIEPAEEDSAETPAPPPEEVITPPVVQTPELPPPSPDPPAAEEPDALIASQVSGSPRLIFPASTLIFDSQSESGTSITYNVVAIDEVDGEVTAECSPPPGSRVPVGKVNVVCTAVDSAGNSALGSFIVEVRLVASEKQQAAPLQLNFDQIQIPEVQFPIVPAVFAGLVGTVVVLAVKVARKTKAKSSHPQQSPS